MCTQIEGQILFIWNKVSVVFEHVLKEKGMEIIQLDLAIIFCVIQVTLCVCLLLFGFEKPKNEEPLKPVDFNWRREGF